MVVRLQKTLIFGILFFTCNAVFAAHLYYRDSVLVQGEYRYYNVHPPKNYNNFSQLPVIMAFHGGGGWGWASIRYQSSLTYIADIKNFIVVYPEGKYFFNSTYRGWNAGQCCEPSSLDSVDDVGFVNLMMDSLIQKYKVDTARMYAVGSSNGAMFCLRLACELSERIAAIAVNAGTQTFFDCHPTRAVPIINFHSLADSTVLYDGGLGIEPPIDGVNFISQDSTMKIWKALNNCQTLDTVVNGADTSFTLIRLTDCSCEYAVMDFYSTTDGGHSWPKGKSNGNPVSKQVDATDLLWKFFIYHIIGCADAAVGINELRTDYDFNIFPNPAAGGNFYLQLKDDARNTMITIYSIDGKILQTQKIYSSITKISLMQPAGIYILQVVTDSGMQVKKLIVK